jgi:hypothetical protein
MLVGDDQSIEAVGRLIGGREARQGFPTAEARVDEQPGLLGRNQRGVTMTPTAEDTDADAQSDDPFSERFRNRSGA